MARMLEKPVRRRRRLLRHGRPRRRALLKDHAYTQILELIQTGVFAPQAFLSERQLVERLGMSKTPIRSALELLEARGLVAVSPQQGIVVKELSGREVVELFDMRAAIEPFVAGRLAERSWEREEVARVKANLSRQRAAAARADHREATRLDIEFHRLLAEVLDNHEISSWLARCFDKLERAILRVNRLAAGRLQKSYEDHAAIATAILAGKGEKASRAMSEHLRYGRRFLMGG
jgi:DNA-binding GntR family transcriptional regulator